MIRASGQRSGAPRPRRAAPRRCGWAASARRPRRRPAGAPASPRRTTGRRRRRPRPRGRPRRAAAGAPPAAAGSRPRRRSSCFSGVPAEARVLRAISWGGCASHREERRTTVGPPAGELTSSRPSAASTRWCSPARPLPLAGWAPPTPSSSTRTSTPPFSIQTPTERTGGPAVLGDVGQRLGDHEVDRGLDVRRQRVRHVDASPRPGPSLRTVSSPSAAARPRSTSSGGAMPRESERSSSTVSRAWSSAASMVSAARLGVVGQLAAGPAEVHRAAGPAAAAARRGCRARAGAARPPRPSRAASRPPSTRRTSCWSSARLLSSTWARLPCSAAANRTTSGRVTQGDRTDHEVEHDLGVPALAEAEQLGEAWCSRRGRRGSSAARTSRSGRRPAAAHQATASENATVPVTSPTRHQTTSSQDCASRSGRSALRQKPSSGRGQR